MSSELTDDSWRDPGIEAALRNGHNLNPYQRERLLDRLATLDAARAGEGLDERIRRLRLTGSDYTTRYGHGWNDALAAVVAALHPDTASPTTPSHVALDPK